MTHINYVSPGGQIRSLEATLPLGWAAERNVPAYGIRRAVFDVALGYVNGFPMRAVLYYAFTRSLSRRVWLLAATREGIDQPDKWRSSGYGRYATTSN